MIRTRQINDIRVRPIIVPRIEKDKIKGYELFPELYSNIFLCAKKKSGKTSVIAKILRDCLDKETRVFCFCATHNKDTSYKAIKTMLEVKGVRAMFFDAIIDEEGVDNLDLILDELKKEENESDIESEEEEEKEDIILYDDPNDLRVKVKKRKPKKVAPKIIFIFDDVSTELKNKHVPKLLKTNRHFKSKVIISSQYPNDLEPGSRRQFDYWILFKGHNDEKLQIVYQNAALNQEFEDFVDIYHYATEGNYNFLYVDVNKNLFRRNFNQQIVVD